MRRVSVHGLFQTFTKSFLHHVNMEENKWPLRCYQIHPQKVKYYQTLKTLQVYFIIIFRPRPSTRITFNKHIRLHKTVVTLTALAESWWKFKSTSVSINTSPLKWSIRNKARNWCISTIGPGTFLLPDQSDKSGSTVLPFADNSIQRCKDTHPQLGDYIILYKRPQEWEEKRKMKFNVSRWHLLSIANKKNSMKHIPEF